MSELPKLPDGFEWWSPERIHSASCDVYVLDDVELSARDTAGMPVSVALALLDANKLNTTANELRAKLDELHARVMDSNFSAYKQGEKNTGEIFAKAIAKKDEQLAKLANARAVIAAEFNRDKSDETDDAAHRLHATGYDAGIKFALDALDGIK